MRLTKEQLTEITGLIQGGAQIRWFKQHFGIVVPCDRQGPILTQATFEALVARRYGISANPAPENRPSVKMVGAA